ncbi:MAG: RNA 2',3'-cyclic phosphodiesterase [Gemmatimonadales bacterium]
MRLFVALNLPEAVRQALWAAAAPARDLDLPLRWVRPDGIHLTLKFLGETADQRAPELRSALARVAGDSGGASAPARPLAVALGGFGAFPDVERPRVVWAGVAGDPALELLQHGLEREFAPLGFPTEARAFRPHVTLARATRDARPADFARAGLDAVLGTLEFAETVVIETLDLMRSELGRDGAVYHVLHRERIV